MRADAAAGICAPSVCAARAQRGVAKAPWLPRQEPIPVGSKSLRVQRGDSNQASHSLTRARRVLSTVYTRVRPRFSCRTKPASSSTRKCRVVVGHLCAKRPAISPAVAAPRKWTVKRICRRAGCASAATTASSAANFSPGSSVRAAQPHRSSVPPARGPSAPTPP